MTRKVIHTDEAPAAVGPYSQAITANGFVYTAGQVPLVPETGALIEGDIQVQTRQALTNLQAVLEAAGSSLQQVIKVTVFFERHGRLQRDERNLRRIFRRRSPGAVCR